MIADGKAAGGFKAPSRADGVAERYRVEARPRLYALGNFDQRVTVLSQQIRALNLAWALVESGRLPTRAGEEAAKVAVIGGGFAGLTLAAALMQKRCRCEITVFEERDTLLPLQQGSDTRWLHPHIYDWPDEGSEAAAAMLPLLNWTAARASDVVVQALTSWREIVSRAAAPPKLFCNARHLQVSGHVSLPDRSQIEWVAEPRDPADGTTPLGSPHACGASEAFDVVILAVGFGLEIDNLASYWRNETFGQPSLEQPRRTYLLSGQGDGAMIDLLRLRISQFRQDRFIDELFEGRTALRAELARIRDDFRRKPDDFPLFDSFDDLRRRGGDFEEVVHAVSRRLRRDTEVILKLRVRNVAELLDTQRNRISFQNAFLVYLLYLCGGFSPTTEDEKALVERHKIPEAHVVRRHGTRRMEQMERLLSADLYKAIDARGDGSWPGDLLQPATKEWDGGYFGFPGRSEDAAIVPDEERTSWRKEYLPGPTSLLATAVCGATAGVLASIRASAAQFRVTLHRTLPIAGEELLQQACEYAGRSLNPGEPTSGRTFPARNATIGLAYRTRRIIRSAKDVTPARLQVAMATLNLDVASRKMASEVGFVLAIPILEPEDSFLRPNPVAAVLYVDSKDEGFWLDDNEVRLLADVVGESLRTVERRRRVPFDRIRNTSLSGVGADAEAADAIPDSVVDALSTVETVDSPRTKHPFGMNFDHSDLTPLMVSAGGTEEPSPTGVSR